MALVAAEYDHVALADADGLPAEGSSSSAPAASNGGGPRSSVGKR